MNLLCPNCQKPLTVPDQYAGQLMKCPLCNGTFGVPPAAPPPTPAPPESEVFRVAPEPPAPRKEPAPAPEPKAEQPPAPPPTPPPAGYEKTASFTLRPQVLVWVAPAALLLIFLLLFFPWVTTYEFGPKQWYSQAGWGTGFGSQWSIWGAFYILLLFPALAVALAAAVLPLLPVKLPPQAERFMKWRSAAVAAVILLLLLLLFAQLAVFGFGLEQVVRTTGEGPKEEKPSPETLEGRLKASAPARTVAQATLERTFWLDLVLLLHFVALAGVGLATWLDHRTTTHPPPRIDVAW